jgi:PKD repeat protein
VDGTIVAYHWDMGDGASYEEMDVSHSFAATGSYTVTLTVTDNDGLSDSAFIVVQVTNERPVAVIDAMLESHNVGDPVTFAATGSYDTDGELVAYDWDFGDGQTAPGVTVQHRYATGGDFVARLTVTDNAGAIDSITQAISVIDSTGNTAPTAVYAVECSDLTCTFDGAASFDADGTIAAYAWDFGDGTRTGGQSVVHSFATAGTYAATLTVTDNGGAADTTTREVNVSSLDSSGITLTVSTYKVKGTKNAELFWTNATGVDVEIHRRRNRATQIISAMNDGAFLDSVGGGGSYSYKVCEIGGLVCSPEVLAEF